MTGADLKVLYIMGRGRSGSTIVANLLNEIDGFFAVGELHNLWRRGLGKGELCGCGVPVPRCEVWSAVASRMRALTDVDPAQVVTWQSEIVRLSHTRALLRRPPGRSIDREALSAYTEQLSAVYRAVAAVTEARVIVDSSKRPEHGALLHLVAGVQPYFLHLVRDPRAVAYSGRRRKVGGDRELRRYGPADSTFRWNRRNLASQAVRGHHRDRSLLLRYEDFALRPRPSLKAILDLLGEASTEPPLKGERTAELGVNHSLSGNPSRFETGTVEIRSDENWRSEQSRRDRFIATSIALPWLPRYGYPVRASRRGVDG